MGFVKVKDRWMSKEDDNMRLDQVMVLDPVGHVNQVELLNKITTCRPLYHIFL